MRNTVGLYHLFGDKEKSKELFLEWCETCGDLCEWDIDRIASDLYLPATDNSERYFHFHRGNILDFLEEQGYYISLEVSRGFDFNSTVYLREIMSRTALYTAVNEETRNIAYECAIRYSIKHLEEKL